MEDNQLCPTFPMARMAFGDCASTAELGSTPAPSDPHSAAKFTWEMPDDLAAEMAKPLPNCRPELDHLIQD